MIKKRYLEVTEEIIKNHIFRVKFNFLDKRKVEWEEENFDLDISIEKPNFEEEFDENVLIDLNDK